MLKRVWRKLESLTDGGAGVTGAEDLAKMSAKEMGAALNAAEARVKDLELENARTRIQMVFMPERAHAKGFGDRPNP